MGAVDRLRDVFSSTWEMCRTRWRRRGYLTTTPPRGIRAWKTVFICALLYCLLLTHRRYDFLQEAEGRRRAMELHLQERAARLRSECAAHPPPLTRMEHNARDAAAVTTNLAAHYYNLHMKAALLHMVYFPRQNFTWCLVPKVASSSWALALMEAEGVMRKVSSSISPQVYLRTAHREIPQRVNETIQASFKYLFVRHPFDRLVSAYRNKLEDSYTQEDGAYFYKTYGRRIVERFRINRMTDRRKEEENSPQNIVLGKEPTFPEFVDYLIHTDPEDYDEHWRPVVMHCHVCQFHFDYIIKYEHFEEEINFLIDMMQENGRLPHNFKLTWENRGDTNKNTAVEYLKQLSEEQLMQLFDKYRLDFLYFDYKTDGYADFSAMNDLRR
ncbi:carbohydrate sulfotransferase 11-like [Scylla paramamosain]|uniref:carbohydrate sulfotransferase 11-like n=1 Tax=Scylla paramamosain TaxID=85552 RepID=UPI003083E00B